MCKILVQPPRHIEQACQLRYRETFVPDAFIQN